MSLITARGAITEISTVNQYGLGNHTYDGNQKYVWSQIHASGVAAIGQHPVFRYASNTPNVLTTLPASLADSAHPSGFALWSVAVGKYFWRLVAGEVRLMTTNTGATSAVASTDVIGSSTLYAINVISRAASSGSLVVKTDFEPFGWTTYAEMSCSSALLLVYTTGASTGGYVSGASTLATIMCEVNVIDQ